MKTERSDAFIQDWKDEKPNLSRSGYTIGRKFNTTPDKLFALFCPTTEYDWLPNWKCDLLHSESGYLESNAIFRTDYFGFDEVWVCANYEPNKRMECIRVAKSISIKFEITVVDHYNGTCTAIWVITFSSLDEEGNRLIERIIKSVENFEQAIDDLEHYVDTGELAAL